MPTLFTSTLFNPEVRLPVLTLFGNQAVVAWRGEANRIYLATTSEFMPTELSVSEIYAAEEQSDAQPALATLGQQVYLAWKGNGNDLLHLARVEFHEPYPGYPVVSGLSHKETFELTGQPPITLLARGDRLILGYYDPEEGFAYTGVIPLDHCPADPLGPMEAVPAGQETACELRRIGRVEEMAAFSCGDTWNLLSRFPTPETLHLVGPGWYSLFLTLKEGQPEVYGAGDTSEWQAIAGEQVILDEQDDALENDAAPSRFWHFIAISDIHDVAGQAEALAAIDEMTLRERYDALAETEYADRLSDEDFAQAWDVLQKLRDFLHRAAAAESYVAHRRRIPAETEPTLEPIGEVTAVVPAQAEAAALVPELPGVLRICMDSHGVEPNSPENEWPFNLLSQRTVMYASGRLAREGEPVLHDYDLPELERCRHVAAEILARVARFPVRHSELHLDFEPFCLPVNRGDLVGEGLTPEVVREAFRGTLHPWATITVEPFAECRVRDIGSEASFYGHRHKDVRKHNELWKELIAWVENQPNLVGGWYVSVDGVIEGVDALRLLVAQTQAGSLAGVVTSGRAWATSHVYTPEEIIRELRKAERDAVKHWVDASGRVVARATLLGFHPETLDPWAETTIGAANKLRQKNRAAYWRALFRNLNPVQRHELSSSWATVQRCLTDGRFNPENGRGDPSQIFCSWNFFGLSDATHDNFSSFSGEEVTQRLEYLNGLDDAWLRQRYDDLRATDYAPFRSEADWEATRQTFHAIRDFYATAAESGWTIVVSITARSEEALAAEAAEALGQSSTAAKSKRKRKAGAGSEEAITDCVQDDELLAPLLESMEAYGLEEEGNDWPHNGISARAVRFSCGQVAQPETVVIHRHDPAELERCRQISTECEERLRAWEPAHDQGGPYRAFFVTANVGDTVPQTITEEFLRNRLFGGTICPQNRISIEPLGRLDGPANILNPFRTWFEAIPGLHGHAAITIGSGNDDESGVVCPFLGVALTDKGSLVGVFGYAIYA